MNGSALNGLTPTLIKVLNTIVILTALHQRSPSLQEIANMLGRTSKSGVTTQIGRLAERGYISFTPRQAYSIRVIDRTPPAMASSLPPGIQALLDRYCRRHDEEPIDVIADAVTLFIDQRECDVRRDDVAVLS
ncbi:MAG: hypothetical protein GC182_02995 [Rhodopseudomonas sp.]|nr:hypothetical protein [Rhodopseudomonas sp.]